MVRGSSAGGGSACPCVHDTQSVVLRAPGRGQLCTKAYPHWQTVGLSAQKRRLAGDISQLSEGQTLGLDYEWGRTQVQQPLQL